MNKIFYIYILILIYGCNTYSEDENSVTNKIKHSKFANYINFEKPIKVLNRECLNQYLSSLDGIIWDRNNVSLEYGVQFHPEKVKNKYQSENIEDKYVLFFIKETTHKDTNYMFEAYYISPYFESLKPCYFNDASLLSVDSLYDIIPNFKDHNINCVISKRRLKHAPGVWEIIPKDSLDIH